MNAKDTCCLCLDKIARIVLGGLFVYAAWGKIQDPAVFANSVASYRFLPLVLVNLFALVLPMLELLAGLALLTTKWPRESALVVLGMLGMFLVGLVQAQCRGLNISCGCFGEAEDGGSIGAAIIRDVLLFVPAVWLVLRPNGWIWQGRICGCALLLICLSSGCSPEKEAEKGARSVNRPEKAKVEQKVAVESKVEKGVVTSCPVASESGVRKSVAEVVVEGKWTTDFPQALKLAREKKHPLIVFESLRGCMFCARLKGVFRSATFAKWVEGTGIYLVEEHRDEAKKDPGQMKAHEFLNELAKEKKLDLPRVGIYWPRSSNDEVRVAFQGVRGKMPGPSQDSLMAAVVGAITATLPDYMAVFKDRPTLEQLLNATARTYKVACEGGGTVHMEPSSGILKDDGTHLTMVATCPKGLVVDGWIGPNGKWVIRGAYKNKLKITYGMPEGTYKVVFKGQQLLRR